MGGVKTAVAHAGGRRGGWLASAWLGGGVWSAGEIPCRLSSGSDAVTPEVATIPSWRVSDVSIPHFLSRAGGNPRTRPGSSVVDVASLAGGAAWYPAGRNLGLWWVNFGGCGSGGSSVLCRAAVVGISSSLFFLFPLRLLCFSPEHSCVSVLVLCNTKGGKPYFVNCLPTLPFVRFTRTRFLPYEDDEKGWEHARWVR